MMKFPTDLKYTDDHEWLSIDKQQALVGVTHYAVEQLGDVVHIELPKVGEEFEAGAAFGTIESTKTVSDLYLPISGTVTDVNSDLLNSLDTLQEDPYEDGWLIKLEVNGKPDVSNLMDSKTYEKYIEEGD